MCTPWGLYQLQDRTSASRLLQVPAIKYVNSWKYDIWIDITYLYIIQGLDNRFSKVPQVVINALIRKTKENTQTSLVKSIIRPRFVASRNLFLFLDVGSFLLSDFCGFKEGLSFPLLSGWGSRNGLFLFLGASDSGDDCFLFFEAPLWWWVHTCLRVE